MFATNALLYGKGIFTTVAICNGQPFLWKKHWRRLGDNAATVGIDLRQFSEEAVLDRLTLAVANTGILGGRARLTFNDETPSTIWTAETAASTSLSIITGELRSVPSEFHLTVSPYTVNSRSPIAGVKSCNYLENILAADEAKKRGFHSAARLNERGEITSAAMANIFWVKDGVLFTPSLKTGCLAGTTREFVLENLPCVEAQEGIDALANAESIFLTSAGLGIVKVRTLDGRVLDESDHPIMHLWPSS